jgi:hypothetical protein
MDIIKSVLMILLAALIGFSYFFLMPIFGLIVMLFVLCEAIYHVSISSAHRMLGVPGK